MSVSEYKFRHLVDGYSKRSYNSNTLFCCLIPTKPSLITSEPEKEEHLGCRDHWWSVGGKRPNPDEQGEEEWPIICISGGRNIPKSVSEGIRMPHCLCQNTLLLVSGRLPHCCCWWLEKCPVGVSERKNTPRSVSVGRRISY